MKQALLSVVFCCLSALLQAQSSFPTTDSLSINNINATFMVHGDMWNGPDTVGSHCYFPSSTRKSVCAAGAIWMSGYDNANTLHVAAQTYRQDGNDYWPGPLLSTSAITYGFSYKWAKIWKVNRNEIQAFRLITTHTVDNTPEAILTWSASGNIYARGNMGIELSIPIGVALAPFEDLNANGIYEPLLGDYPKVKGDEALWWVFNDDGPQHIVTSSPPLHAEVQAMAYAYKRNNAIDNAIFIEYKVINKGTFNYDSFRLAQFADLDLGHAQDNYIGFDSVRGMGIVYNSDLVDGFSSWDTVFTYGSKPPMAGVLLLDLSQSVVGVNNVGSFTYYINDLTFPTYPSTGVHYSNYCRSRWYSGFHFKNDFAGEGIYSSGSGSDPDTKYVFSGDPGISTDWSECVCNNFPNDKRVILSSKDFRFDAGDTVFMAISLLVKADTASLGCPNASFAPIKSLADSIIYFYHNPPATYPLNIAVHEVDRLKVYPNPATDYLTIELQDNVNQGMLDIHDATGRLVLSTSISNPQNRIDIRALVPGVYFLKCNMGNAIFNSVVVKQ